MKIIASTLTVSRTAPRGTVFTTLSVPDPKTGKPLDSKFAIANPELFAIAGATLVTDWDPASAPPAPGNYPAHLVAFDPAGKQIARSAIVVNIVPGGPLALNLRPPAGVDAKPTPSGGYQFTTPDGWLFIVEKSPAAIPASDATPSQN